MDPRMIPEAWNKKKIEAYKAGVLTKIRYAAQQYPSQHRKLFKLRTVAELCTTFIKW